MGGNSSTQSAPQGYQPTGQGPADSNFQSLINNATPWVNQLPGQVIPGLQQAASNIANNGYNGQALNGALTAGNAAVGVSQAQGANGAYLTNLANNNSNTTQPWQLASLQSLSNQSQATGNQAAQAGQGVMGAGNTAWGQTQGMIPSTTGGAQYANGLMGQAQGLAGLTSNTALSAIPGLTQGMGAANQVLQTGFDPQGALYDRTLQQTLDQQNAINAMNGVSGSAYGSGLSGDATRNFNIDWQNNQLARQTQALGAYGAEQGQVTSDLTGLLGSAAGNYANLSGLGSNQYNAMTSGAVNNLTSLVNSGMNSKTAGFNALNAGLQTQLQGQNQAASDINSAVSNQNAINSNSASLYGASSDLMREGLQTYLQGQVLPSTMYQGQQADIMSALQSLAQGGAQSLQPTVGLSGMDATYMGLGQSATRNAQNAVSANNQQATQNQQGIGQMFGTAAQIAMSFF